MRKARMTYMPNNLVLTHEQLDDIHRRLERTRSNRKTIEVERQSLIRLLFDHAAMHGRLDELERNRGILEAPPAPKPGDDII